MRHCVIELASKINHATIDVFKMPAFMHCVSTVATLVCVQLPTSADNVALLAFADATERRPCYKRSTSPARRAHSSKPAVAAAEWRDHQKDRRTDVRPDDFMDTAPHAMRALSIGLLVL